LKQILRAKIREYLAESRPKKTILGSLYEDKSYRRKIELLESFTLNNTKNSSTISYVNSI